MLATSGDVLKWTLAARFWPTGQNPSLIAPWVDGRAPSVHCERGKAKVKNERIGRTGENAC